MFLLDCEMTLSGGECFDIFDAPCFACERFEIYDAVVFDILREKLFYDNRGFLTAHDWEDKTCHSLDERTRRKYIVELDKLSYYRKYNKENLRWVMGRHSKCFFWKDTSSNWILYSHKDPRSDPLQEVLDAYDVARAARFEHGE